MVLALVLTRQCNFHCRHCMVDSSYEESLVQEGVVEAFIDMCRSWKPDKIYLIGGEVLLKLNLVEMITDAVREHTGEIVIFSNGSFLLNEEKAKRVEKLDCTIRISDDVYHREFWSPELKERIENSKYWVARKDEDEDMIPVGRAYEEFKHLEYNMGCSLLTGVYDERYPNGHRCMVMMNGDVNLYCATIEAALANVFEDPVITWDMLVEREKILHNYLAVNVLRSVEDTYMAKLCNMCSQYKVTSEYIYYRGKKAASVKEYSGEALDLYRLLGKEEV